MKHLRLAALVLVPLLAVGCDVALGVYFASKKDSKKTPAGPPAPELRLSLWVANLSTSGKTDTQIQSELATNLGPTGTGTPPSEWTKAGDFSQTTEIDTVIAPGTWDSILLVATDKQVYEIDAFEVLDATGSTIAKGSASNLFGNLITPDLLAVRGSPDGLVSTTAATATDKAFLFLHHSATITRGRVSLWQPGVRTSGDVVWAQTYSKTLDQIAGGAAVNSSGTIYLAVRDVNNIALLRYDANGNVVQDNHLPPRDLTSIAPISTSEGHASIVIDLVNHRLAGPSTVDNVYIATPEDPGDIRLFMFQSNKESAEWTNAALGGAGIHRVEPNGLALDSNGDLVLAGGFDTAGVNKVQHYIKKHSKDNGSDLWAGSPPPSAPPDITDSYWFSVAATGTNSIIASGNVSPSLGVLPDINIRTQRLLDGSPVSVTQTWDEDLEDNSSTNGIGRSVGVDGSGNAYVGGFFTHSGNNDSVILRYGSGAPPGTVHFPPPALLNRTGNDEFLDLAVDADGTLYAVGYETNGAQGSDLVLYKIAANGQIVWKRTVHENGNDRGVSVVSTPTHVIVVGELEIAAGNKDIHVRKYVK